MYLLKATSAFGFRMNRIKNYQKTYTVTTVDSKQATTVLVQYTHGWLEFNILFQHQYGYIIHERSGVESYPLTQ